MGERNSHIFNLYTNRHKLIGLIHPNISKLEIKKKNYIILYYIINIYKNKTNKTNTHIQLFFKFIHSIIK